MKSIDHLRLKTGSHRKLEDGACLLEVSAYLAGEPHTDHPACVSPVLGAFGRVWWDGLLAGELAGQADLAERLVGTADGSRGHEARRLQILVDGAGELATLAGLAAAAPAHERGEAARAVVVARAREIFIAAIECP